MPLDALSATSGPIVDVVGVVNVVVVGCWFVVVGGIVYVVVVMWWCLCVLVCVCGG